MRKVVALYLWVDDDSVPGGDEHYMQDKGIKEDIEAELGYCWHNFDVVKFETMEIANERATENI